MSISKWTVALGVGFALVACSKEQPKEEPAEPAAEEPTAEAEKAAPKGEDLVKQANQMFGVLPDEMVTFAYKSNDAMVKLGKTLYFDPRLSRSQEISCNTCHALDSFGVDPRPKAMESGKSPGHNGQLGDRNSPTVYNAAIHIAQFWDGREPTVEAQAKGPILNSVEMAHKADVDVVGMIKSIPDYAAMFEAAFPEAEDPITYDNLATAIGAFERKLVTPSPFDAWLKGDEDAISDEAKQGLETFIAAGCTSCHMGKGVGGGMYQKLGLIKPYETEDEGRFAITKNEGDKFFFKVPSLRNVEKTAPYFHDGSVKTLGEAIKLMGIHQTAQGEPSAEQIASIEAFLETLTGTPPADLIAPPELPKSGPKTPKPDKS